MKNLLLKYTNVVTKYRFPIKIGLVAISVILYFIPFISYEGDPYAYLYFLFTYYKTDPAPISYQVFQYLRIAVVTAIFIWLIVAAVLDLLLYKKQERHLFLFANVIAVIFVIAYSILRSIMLKRNVVPHIGFYFLLLLLFLQLLYLTGTKYFKNHEVSADSQKKEVDELKANKKDDE